MRHFSPIVGVLSRVVGHGRHDSPVRCRVAPQLVRHQLPRFASLPLQEPTKEPPGRLGGRRMRSHGMVLLGGSLLLIGAVLACSEPGAPEPDGFRVSTRSQWSGGTVLVSSPQISTSRTESRSCLSTERPVGVNGPPVYAPSRWSRSVSNSWSCSSGFSNPGWLRTRSVDTRRSSAEHQYTLPMMMYTPKCSGTWAGNSGNRFTSANCSSTSPNRAW